MKSIAFLIIFIVTLVPLLNNVLVESAALQQADINKIIAHDNKATLSSTEVDEIFTIPSDTTLIQIYDTFLKRKAGIQGFIDANQQQQEDGYRAMLLLLAAFDTKQPTPEITDTQKQDIVTKILDISPGGSTTDIDKLLSDTTTGTTLAKIFNTDTSGGSTTTTTYDMGDLLGAAHYLRLHLPNPIKGTTNTPEQIKAIRAIGRLTVLINELIKSSKDFEAFSLAVARGINLPATDDKRKNSLFHYATVKDDVAELEREYAWKKMLLDPIQHTNPPTALTDAHKTLQADYHRLLPTVVKKVHNDFPDKADSRILAFAILSQLPKDPDVTAMKKERTRIDGHLALAPASGSDAAEAKLAVEEAFLYAKLDASDYAAASTVLQPAEKTAQREPAIHDAMKIRRLHLQTNYKEILDNPTKETSATKVQEKTKELKDKQEAFTPKTNNDDDLNKAIDEAIKKIQDAEIQLFPPNPPQNPTTQPSPAAGGGGGAPASGNPRTPEVVKELEEMEFNNKPPLKVPADQCTDVGTNCGDIVRMCIIPAYVRRMHQNCRRTCRVCFPEGEPCQDQFPDCQMWKDGGYCTSRIPKALKMMQCPVTCGLCPS